MPINKKIKIGLIALGSAIVLTVTGFVIIPKLKNKPDETMPDETLKVPETTTTNTTPSASVSVNPIGDKADIQKFQDWLDVKHPNWLDNKTSLNKGTGYGNFGKQTSNAWAKHATEYQTVTPTPAVVKTHKAYARVKNTPIYSKVGDLIPYRRAGDSEYIGNLTGVIKKNFNGLPFVELLFPDKSFKYVVYGSVKLNP